MSTLPRTTLDVTDEIALRVHVDALPLAERVAYYRANPTYMDSMGQYPAYVVHEAAQHEAAGRRAEADAVLSTWYFANRQRQLDAAAAVAAPKPGDRVAGGLLGIGKGAYIPFIASLIAGALGMYPAAATLTGVAVVFGFVGALTGVATGGRSNE